MKMIAYMDCGMNDTKEIPDVNSLLSSLIRLMSNYIKEPSTSQVMTLIHLIDLLEQHPELSSFPAAEIAVQQARLIWNDEIIKIGSGCVALCDKSDKKLIH